MTNTKLMLILLGMVLAVGAALGLWGGHALWSKTAQPVATQTIDTAMIVQQTIDSLEGIGYSTAHDTVAFWHVKYTTAPGGGTTVVVDSGGYATAEFWQAEYEAIKNEYEQSLQQSHTTTTAPAPKPRAWNIGIAAGGITDLKTITPWAEIPIKYHHLFVSPGVTLDQKKVKPKLSVGWIW